MRCSPFLPVVLLSLALASTVRAQGSSDFLYFTPDPCTATLGEGAAALRNGAVAVLMNPAGVAYGSGKELYISHVFLTLDRRLSAMAFSIPMGERAALGLGVMQAAITDIDGRDLNGRHTEYLSDTKNVASFIFSFKPTERFSLGLSFRALFRKTAEEDASGVAFDIGSRALVGKGIVVAMVGHNLGLTRPLDRPYGAYWSWNTKYWGDSLQQQKDDRIPPSLGLSVAFTRLPARLRAAMGLLKIEGETARVSGGLEFPVDERLLLRLGGELDSPSIGFRFVTPLPYAVFFFDYAYGKGNITEDPIHRVSVSTRF